MLSRHFIKLAKPRCLTYVNNIQNFNTGNKLMERIPRDITNCEHLRPDHVPKSSEDVDPRSAEDTSFSFGRHEAPPIKSLNIFSPAEYWDYAKKQTCEKEQQCDRKKLKMLGNNLNAANFIIEWGGQVKFKNSSDWVPSVKNTRTRLPGTHSPEYVVTAINADDTLITYNGVEHILYLRSLTWLSLKNCPYIDDWCIDRISGNTPALQYLDISGCQNVTERALEALYRLEHLNTLIVTNHYKSAAFELTCLMLEDCLPNLKCHILNSRYPDENEKSPQKE